MTHQLGIVGLGFVGTAVETGFMKNLPGAEIRTHDKFKDTESLASVVDNSSIIFLCLPTPMNEDRSCNTSIMEEVVENINRLDKNKTLVIKSTVPPGTTERLAAKHPEQTIVFNPEFLTERNFINDFLEQDRIFLGVTPGYKEGHVKALVDLYRDFCKNQESPGNVFVVDSKAAEMLKYTTNCFLAAKVSFFNEIYDICQALKVDFGSVVELLKMDKRIGKSHMSVPGFDGKRGWGGSCFPKDLNALVSLAEDLDVDALMLESAWVKNLTVRTGYEWEELAQVTGKYERK
jgi:UDPglucose 6-dehydrogenase